MSYLSAQTFIASIKIFILKRCKELRAKSLTGAVTGLLTVHGDSAVLQCHLMPPMSLLAAGELRVQRHLGWASVKASCKEPGAYYFFPSLLSTVCLC